MYQCSPRKTNEHAAQDRDLTSIVGSLERQVYMAMALTEMLLNARRVIGMETAIVTEIRAVLAQMVTVRRDAPALEDAPPQPEIGFLQASLEACLRQIERV
jgi:hypothetical protein